MAPRTGRPRARAPRIALAGLLGLALLTSGCFLPRTAGNAVLPPEWHGKNGWGPEANALRAQGALQLTSYTPQMADWAEFGRQTCQEGDLLFRFGHSYDLIGKWSSWIIAAACASPFSHAGIAHWENDKLWVYDAEREGIRKVLFEVWMLDVKGDSLAIKRLLPAYRFAIPQAIAFCDDVYQRQVPFDLGLAPGDDRLYCSEMIGKAFASAGLPLFALLPIRCLPNYRRFAFLRPLATVVSGVRVDSPLYAVGNDYYGAYGSPYLELVYEGKDVRRRARHSKPPTCAFAHHP